MRKAEPAPTPHAVAGADARLRFDKWLWAARFCRTRTLAAQAIDTGQARLNDERVKPARGVRVGDTITVRRAGLVWSVEVTGLADRRGSAAAAATLYREAEASLAARTEERLRRKAEATSRPMLARRPTKRDRRKLADFLAEP